MIDINRKPIKTKTKQRRSTSPIKKKKKKKMKKKSVVSSFVDIWGLARKGNFRDVLALLDIRPRRIPVDAVDRSRFGKNRTLLIIASATWSGGDFKLVMTHVDWSSLRQVL